MASEYQEMAADQLNRQVEAEEAWAQEAQLGDHLPQGILDAKASGEIVWGGLGAGSVSLDFLFQNGQKMHFEGFYLGNIVGYAKGKGAYIGNMPADGDKWNFHCTALDGVVGGISMTFNPVWGPRGAFLGGTEGAGAISVVGYGAGRWSKA